MCTSWRESRPARDVWVITSYLSHTTNPHAHARTPSTHTQRTRTGQQDSCFAAFPVPDGMGNYVNVLENTRLAKNNFQSVPKTFVMTLFPYMLVSFHKAIGFVFVLWVQSWRRETLCFTVLYSPSFIQLRFLPSLINPNFSSVRINTWYLVNIIVFMICEYPYTSVNVKKSRGVLVEASHLWCIVKVWGNS